MPRGWRRRPICCAPASPASCGRPAQQRDVPSGLSASWCVRQRGWPAWQAACRPPPTSSGSPCASGAHMSELRYNACKLSMPGRMLLQQVVPSANTHSRNVVTVFKFRMNLPGLRPLPPHSAREQVVRRQLHRQILQCAAAYCCFRALLGRCCATHARWVDTHQVEPLEGQHSCHVHRS